MSRLSDRADEAEGAVRRAAGAIEEESAGLRASLSAEFAQVGVRLVRSLVGPSVLLLVLQSLCPVP